MKVVASNAGWQSTQQAAIQATGFAPASPQEAAVLITAAPGPYTVVVEGTNGSSGTGLIETFVVEPTP
jgi:hypothetical protein